MITGRILEIVADRYTVMVNDHDIICHPRGRLRIKGTAPAVGDDVEISMKDDATGMIERILPRRNYIERPTIANVDQVVVVLAKKPQPNWLLIDRILVTAENLDMSCLIVVNKVDLFTKPYDSFMQAYQHTGYPIFYVSTYQNVGIEAFSQACAGHINVMAGQSGVGKSSLLNKLSPGVNLRTGSISEKRGFGRHTTQKVKLIALPHEGYVADTPGFNKLDLGDISGDNMAAHFPEMLPYLGKCYYSTCLHRHEPDCAVKAALEQGLISNERYQSYLTFLEEMQSKEKRKYK